MGAPCGNRGDGSFALLSGGLRPHPLKPSASFIGRVEYGFPDVYRAAPAVLNLSWKLYSRNFLVPVALITPFSCRCWLLVRVPVLTPFS